MWVWVLEKPRLVPTFKIRIHPVQIKHIFIFIISHIHIPTPTPHVYVHRIVNPPIDFFVRHAESSRGVETRPSGKSYSGHESGGESVKLRWS
jgi:hypothetical protein